MRSIIASLAATLGRLLLLGVLALGVVTGAGASATAAGYSATCTDWKAKGYARFDACLQDGRWHLVYGNDARGNKAAGSLALLVQAIKSSADVKVSSYSPPYSDGTLPTLWSCTTIQAAGQGLTCWDAVRLAGVIQSAPYLGAAALGTNGTMICVGLHAGNANGATIISNDGGQCPNAAFDWWVRY